MDTNKILAKLGISELNAMQQEAMDTILRRNDDVVILSPTGSGKTLAYLLPLIQKLDERLDQVQMLVVVPGRELALQSQTVLKNMGSGLRSMALYGGRATMDEHRKMREVQPQVVFATPGRINDHLLKENVSPLFIKYVVIDEFENLWFAAALAGLRSALAADGYSLSVADRDLNAHLGLDPIEVFRSLGIGASTPAPRTAG